MIWRKFFIIGCVVAVLSWTHTVHADEGLTYRYIKWEITEKKGIEGCAGRACVQVSEFNLTHFGQTVAWPEGTSVTNPGGGNPEGEESPNLVDGDTNTKWLDHNFNADENQSTGNSVVIIDAGENIVFDGYEWATANDVPERDPISWNLHGSADGTNWTLIDAVTDEDVTDDRFAYLGFSIYGTFYTGVFSNVTKTSATLSGDLFPGNTPLREIGFRYDTDPLFSDPSQTAVETETFENTAYSASVSGLSCGTRYFYKAYLVAEDDMVIDSELTPSFSTAPCIDLANEPLDGESYEVLRRSSFNESWTGVSASDNGQIIAALWAGIVDDEPTGRIYVSVDGGTTWESRISAPDVLFTSVAVSGNGQKMIAVGSQGFSLTDELGIVSIYVSEDTGATWEERSEIDDTEFLEDAGIPDISFLPVVLLMGKVSASDDFSVIYLSFFDKIYKSTDAGDTWERISEFSYPGLLISSLDVSADGGKVVSSFVSMSEPPDEFPSIIITNALDQWIPVYFNEEASFFSISMSSDGRRIFAIDSLGRMHVSLDEGLTWHLSENPDGYGWVSVISSETGNGVFAAALNELIDDEEVETTLLALYYSADGGTTWEKVSETDVSDRSYVLSFGAAISGRISAAQDLSRIGLTSLFDLYVITRGELAPEPSPAPAQPTSHSRGRSSVRNMQQASGVQTIAELQARLGELLSLLKQLLAQYQKENGIVLETHRF